MKFKSDKYKKDRGGYSRLLEISCEKCNNVLFFYQKDGPGPLKRMYSDRIIGNIKYSNLPVSFVNKATPLVCSNCKRDLGIPIIYQKEKRFAYRLFQDSVTKKIVKSGSVSL